MVERTGATNIKIHSPTWLSEFKIHCRLVDRYRVGRVFVAGDAAHVHSPTGGARDCDRNPGRNESGLTIGSRAVPGAPEHLLDTYEEERRPTGAAVLEETARTTRLLL